MKSNQADLLVVIKTPQCFTFNLICLVLELPNLKYALKVTLLGIVPRQRKNGILSRITFSIFL